MRIAWRTVGWICERVDGRADRRRDLFAGLERIGIDEISIRKGQRYLTVVVDHDTGRLVWAAPAATSKTVEQFLDLLGRSAAQQLKLVSCDMADWITGPVAERCPNATVCLDPFHVVKLATDALDEIRREVWNEARRAGQRQLAARAQGRPVRALEEPRATSPSASSSSSRASRQINKRLYRAYLLAQQLRQIYRVPFEQALAAARRVARSGPDDAAWSRSSSSPGRSPSSAEGIEAALRHGLSNARVEQVNTQLRLITRRGFGFHSPRPSIALAMLSLGGLCPPLPGR